MRMLRPAARPRPGGAVAPVTYSGKGGFGAVGASERRDIPVFAPGGIRYRPCQGDSLLLLNLEGSQVCAGVLCDAGDLEPGEVRITSPGGGEIRLGNDGGVRIGPFRFTAEGQILYERDGKEQAVWTP